MWLSFLYGLIGIVFLVFFCLLGAFLVPQNAYWFMTPYAKGLLEKYGVPKEFKLKDKLILGLLILIAGTGFVLTIIYAGKQGVASGMNFLQLTLRYVIFFWMVSVFDAIVLDWWMFTKTDIFGVLIKRKTGKTPDVWRVDPQWDGKEIHKIVIEVFVSALLAWIFLKIQ